MILIPVQQSNVDVFSRRIPGYSCKVMIFRFAGFQKNGFHGFRVKNSQGNMMAGFAGHGVFCVFNSGNSRVDVHQWIVGYHGFIFAIKGQFFTVRRPESSGINPKLNPMNGLPVYNPGILIICNLNHIPVHHHKEVVFDGIGKITTLFIEIDIFGRVRNFGKAV